MGPHRRRPLADPADAAQPVRCRANVYVPTSHGRRAYVKPRPAERNIPKRFQRIVLDAKTMQAAVARNDVNVFLADGRRCDNRGVEIPRRLDFAGFGVAAIEFAIPRPEVDPVSFGGNRDGAQHRLPHSHGPVLVPDDGLFARALLQVKTPNLAARLDVFCLLFDLAPRKPLLSELQHEVRLDLLRRVNQVTVPHRKVNLVVGGGRRREHRVRRADAPEFLAGIGVQCHKRLAADAQPDVEHALIHKRRRLAVPEALIFLLARIRVPYDLRLASRARLQVDAIVAVVGGPDVYAVLVDARRGLDMAARPQAPYALPRVAVNANDSRVRCRVQPFAADNVVAIHRWRRKRRTVAILVVAPDLGARVSVDAKHRPAVGKISLVRERDEDPIAHNRWRGVKDFFCRVFPDQIGRVRLPVVRGLGRIVGGNDYAPPRLAAESHRPIIPADGLRHPPLDPPVVVRGINNPPDDDDETDREELLMPEERKNLLGRCGLEERDQSSAHRGKNTRQERQQSLKRPHHHRNDGIGARTHHHHERQNAYGVEPRRPTACHMGLPGLWPEAPPCGAEGKPINDSGRIISDSSVGRKTGRRREAPARRRATHAPTVGGQTGGANGARTRNLGLAKAALSQLSYGPKVACHYARIPARPQYANAPPSEQSRHVIPLGRNRNNRLAPPNQVG